MSSSEGAYAKNLPDKESHAEDDKTMHIGEKLGTEPVETLASSHMPQLDEHGNPPADYPGIKSKTDRSARAERHPEEQDDYEAVQPGS